MLKENLNKNLKTKQALVNGKIALEQGRLMDCIVLLRDTEVYDDDTIDYIKTAIIKDIDDGKKDYKTAIDYLNNDIEFISQEIENELAQIQ